MFSIPVESINLIWLNFYCNYFFFILGFQLCIAPLQEYPSFLASLLLVVVALAATKQYSVETNTYAFGKALLAAPLVLAASLFIFHLPHNISLYLFSYQIVIGCAEQALAQSLHKKSHTGLYYQLERLFKRAFDTFFAIVMLLLFLPLLATVSILIIIDLKQNPFFLQTRIGLDNRPFKMFKLKSMCAEKNETSVSNPIQNKNLYDCRNDKRITRLGQYLRKFSIDELPQIINVLLGHMSFIGPRPLIPQEHDLVDRMGTRTQVRPGLSGLWQVKGRVNYERNATSVAQYDEEYVKTWSTCNDLKIFLMTIPVVLFCRGGK